MALGANLSCFHNIKKMLFLLENTKNNSAIGFLRRKINFRRLYI